MKCKYEIYEETFESEEDLQCSIINKILDKQQKRDVIRPDTPVLHDILTLFLTALITSAFLFSIHLFNMPKFIFITILTITLIILFILNIKKIILTSIIIYQKYAPESVRSSCLFEPCCSEYMKISIEKYGVIKGVIKGIKRILRCHYPKDVIELSKDISYQAWHAGILSISQYVVTAKKNVHLISMLLVDCFDLLFNIENKYSAVELLKKYESNFELSYYYELEGFDDDVPF